MKKDVLVQLLTNIDNYHNHKEKMAWTSISIYLIFSIVFINWLLSTDLTNTILDKAGGSTEFKIFILVIIVMLFVATFSFAFMQFTMRWIVSCRALILRRLLFNVDEDHELYKYSNTLDPTTFEYDSYFPRKISNKINVLVRERNAKTFLCALISILLIFGIFCNSINGRYKSEIPSYLVMFFFLIPTIIIFCNKVF